MYPTFGGGGDAAATDDDNPVSSHFQQMRAEDPRDAQASRDLRDFLDAPLNGGWDNAGAGMGQSAVSSFGPVLDMVSSTASTAISSISAGVSANAPTSEQLRGYMAGGISGVASLAADAKLGMQVARVHLGLDGQVRKACNSKALSQLGASPAAVLRPLVAPAADAPAEPEEPEGIRELICSSRVAQQHLKVVVSAMTDYQRHRQGLAEASHRLGLALQEAGQRSPGDFGEALGACGKAHHQAALARREASSADELRVLSKLRAHDGKAAADCRRAVRRYEVAVEELRLLRRARLEAQLSKEAASGDSLIAPHVEGEAARCLEVALQRVREAGDTAEGKLRMFQAKHRADYASSVAAHVTCIAAEERRVAEAFNVAETSFVGLSRLIDEPVFGMR